MPEKYGQNAGCMNKNERHAIREKATAVKDDDCMSKSNKNCGFHAVTKTLLQDLSAEIETPHRIEQRSKNNCFFKHENFLLQKFSQRGHLSSGYPCISIA